MEHKYDVRLPKATRRPRRPWTSRSRSHARPRGAGRPERREHAALPGRQELAHRRGVGLRGVDLGGASV